MCAIGLKLVKTIKADFSACAMEKNVTNVRTAAISAEKSNAIAKMVLWETAACALISMNVYTAPIIVRRK